MKISFTNTCCFLIKVFNNYTEIYNTTQLFQYISFGVPVICSNSTAQANLINAFECGKVFEEKNSNDFEKKVLSLFNNKKEYELLKTNCLNAIKKLNNSVVSKELISIYE